MRQMCIYCFKWADIDTMTPLLNKVEISSIIIARIVLLLLWIICLSFQTNMYANNQEPTNN